MKYIVYEHKFKTSGKSYIGYTSLTIEKRLHKHFTNSIYGMETKFYRAIRKYGISDIESYVLYECYSQEEAHEKEKEIIKEKDTFVHGYNMTLGGDGGNCMLKMTSEQKRIFCENRKKRAIGENNSNYSGLTDNDIISKAISYFLLNKKITRNKWHRHCTKNNIPKTYSKCRFNGNGYNGFIENLKSRLTELGVVWNELQFYLTKEERYDKNYQP